MKFSCFSHTMTKAVLALLTAIGCLHGFTAAATEYEVTNTSNSAATTGSLPWAVAPVNAGAGTGDVITFNIPGPGPFTISLASQLTLSKKARIDGTTQPFYSTSPLIVLDGGGSVARSILVSAPNSAVMGLAITGFTSEGIWLASSDDTISQCYIGTDATGTTAVPNKHGIFITATRSFIGGIGAGNLISGNSQIGIYISAKQATIQGNYIGLNAAGTAMLSNGAQGISTTGTADSNLIGGTTPGAGNVITSNENFQIQINSKGNVIQGNIIGMNAAGTDTLINRTVIVQQRGGVNMVGDSNLLGGSAAGARNYITTDYVSVAINGGRGNVIQGNYVGLNKAGTAAMVPPQIIAGIVAGGIGTIVGGSAPGEGNVVSGSQVGQGVGIGIAGNGGGTIIHGNIVGFDPTLTIRMGFGIGINIDGSSGTVGGTGNGEGNIVANNTRAMVVVSTRTNNRISGNSVYNNSRGIDFGDNGATFNDMPDINGVLNFPVITSITQAGGNTTISGTYDGLASLAITIEFFGNDTLISTGYGEGKNYLGNTIINTDASGHATFSVIVPGTHNIVSSTASADGYNTSEFSRTGPLFTNTSATLNICKNAAATDIKALVQALDPHIGATLTWQNALSPSHGALVVTSATASSGGSDITPGGTITYKPTAGYIGSDAFRIRITDSKSTVTMTVTVTVYDLPAITASNSGPVCGGADLNINSTASGGTPGYTYTWSGPNGFTSTTEDNTLSGVAANATGLYTVMITDTYGCKDTGTTAVTINPLPIINSAASNTPICSGNSLQITTSATGGTGALAYSWSGPNSFSQTGNNPEITSATTAATGTYTVIVTDESNCADTGTTAAVVNSRPAITAIGTSGAVCEDNPLSLFSSVSGGSGTYAFAWTGPNSFSSTDEDPLVASSATVAANGTYELTVTDDNNCEATGTNTTAVTIYGHQPVTGKDSVLFGTTITLSNTVGGGTWSTPTPWKTGVTSITGIVKGVSAGMSQVSYTTGDGCVSTHTVTVFMGHNVCVGQTTALTDTLVGGTWTSNNGSIASVNAATGIVKGIAAGRAVIAHRTSTAIITTTVTVNPLAATSSLPTVCQGQSLTLTNNTPGGGTWYSGNTAIAAVSSSGIATATEGGTVTIYFTPYAGCATERMITINAVTPITGPSSVCMGQTVNMSNSTPGGAWSSSAGALAPVNAAGIVKGMSTGAPRISYIWPNGCHAVKTMTVNTLSQITGGTMGICASSGMTLANATPFGGVWSSSNSSAATVNPATGFVKGTGPGSTVISFTTNVAGCVATRTVTVNACREGGEETTAIAETTHEDNIRLYPNPNNGQFMLEGTLVTIADGDIEVEVVNMLGQMIFKSTAQLQNGHVAQRIELQGNLANGMYLLNMRAGNSTRIFRFVVER